MKRLRSFFNTLRDSILAASGWILRRLPLIVALVLTTVIVIEAIAFLYSMSGSGFAGKSLWDWLNLLVVPLILAIGGIAINSTIQRSERKQAEERAKVDRELADDRLKEQALQTYLDRVSELLLKEHLDDPKVGEKARIVARARTLTTLRGLDGERRAAVLQFLHEIRANYWRHHNSRSTSCRFYWCGSHGDEP